MLIIEIRDMIRNLELSTIISWHSFLDLSRGLVQGVLFPGWWSRYDDLFIFPGLRKLSLLTYMPPCYCPKDKSDMELFFHIVRQSEQILEDLYRKANRNAKVTFEHDMSQLGG